MTIFSGDGMIVYVGQGDPVINLRILWSDMILTVWPEHIKTMLATDFPNYEKGMFPSIKISCPSSLFV